LLEALPVFRTQ